ncbi:MAG: hypothetical protein LBQ57_06950 [Spirochaetales bacterium]|jgi:hypothetical protein|nr:hypothetical protein [Spirochaetales bacterium]
MQEDAPQSPRPEEVIAELWRQIQGARAAGKKPEKIILSIENYRTVQAWHAALGELTDPEKDYITRYTIFNLPVFIDPGAGARVE